MNNKLNKIETYIISLKKDETKCNNVIKNLENSGIKNVKKFDAINGKDLSMTLEPIGYKHPFVNVSLSAQYTLYNGRKEHKELSSKGAVGCYLSHVLLWKKLVESDNEYMLIFEDDVVPLYINSYEKINELLNESNGDFDILLLGCNCRDKNKIEVSKNINKCIFFFELHSYIISKKAANELLKYIYPIDMQIDSYISFYNLINPNFKTYYSKKHLFRQSKHISNIQNKCLTCFFLELQDKEINKIKIYKFILYFIIFIIFIIFIFIKKN
jgi:glycosyl transferase family 25